MSSSAFSARLGLLRRAGGGPTDIRMGGMLHGPGTPTSDSLLLLGSTKEFMVQAKAAQQPGALQFLNAFNRGHISMATLRAALKDLPRFHRAGRSWRRWLRPRTRTAGW